jgi:hypothetical protein
MKIEYISKKYKIEKFIERVTSHLREYKGRIIFKNPTLNSNSSDGEFSEYDMTIKCILNTSSTYWIGVLAHEYAHFLQCISENKYWTDFQKKVADINNFDNIFKRGKNAELLNNKKRLNLSSSIIKMELDCDKAAIKLINKYKLPVDKKEYSSKANIVLYKYLYWGKYGIWPSLLDRKTGKEIDYSKLKVSKLMHEEKYKSTKDIPDRIIYLFDANKFNIS